MFKKAAFGIGMLSIVLSTAASAAPVRPTAVSLPVASVAAAPIALPAPTKARVVKHNDLFGLPVFGVVIGLVALVTVVVVATDGSSSPS
jgi:hypothetical protein